MPSSSKRQRLLQSLPDSAFELSRKLGISDSWARRVLREEHAKETVYIVAWRRRRGQGKRGGFAPIFKIGKNKDCPMPTPDSNAERCKRWRAKVAAARRLVPGPVVQTGLPAGA